MELKQIIDDPLVQDAYKYNMGALIHKEFPTYMTKWDFKCRNANVKFTSEMVDEICEQVDAFCKLRYSEEDLNYLRKNFPWLPEAFIQHLKRWQPDRSYVKINEDGVKGYNDCGLVIEAYGPWLDVTFFEIPVLAIVNEVYFAFKHGVGAKDEEFKKRTVDKFSKVLDGTYDLGVFSEFGLRRRYSAATQDWLVKYVVDQKIPGFVGTSNVHLAKKHGVKAVGTQAHELFMGMMGNPRENPAYCNRTIMEKWTDLYGVKNGICLTDTIGTEVFLKDFDEKFATLFNGVRHDSGDPIWWGNLMLEHYKKLGIDPRAKTLLFSDSLDFEKAAAIKKHFDGKCNVAFGIGTYLAGVQDETPLNIVMKMTECNGFPVCKLSNNDGKIMCRNAEFINYLKRTIDWRLKHV